jgi:hypothetical protein
MVQLFDFVFKDMISFCHATGALPEICVFATEGKSHPITGLYKKELIQINLILYKKELIQINLIFYTKELIQINLNFYTKELIQINLIFYK